MSAEPTSRNFWPLGIVVAFVLFIAGTAALIALASAHRPELVRPDYYEQELRHQDQIERVARTRRLQPPPTVRHDSAANRLTVALPPEHARRGARGRIHLYRPSARGLDRQIELRLDPNGLQTIEAYDLQPGLWKVQVSWSVEALEYYLDQNVIVN